MPSTYRKLLNQGTSSPIVARTTVQPDTIMAPFPLSKEAKAEIFSVNISLCQRLLSMEEFTIWLAGENDAIKSEFLAHGLKQIGDDAFEATHIIDLENRAESYLQSSKLCIRDCGLIFGAVVGAPFDHKFHRIVKWGEKKFGTRDDFVTWLTRHENWIKTLLQMRNALEHPTASLHGKLNI